MPFVEKEIYTFGHFVLDPAERVLSCGGTPVCPTPGAFDTLLVLVRNPGRVLTKDGSGHFFHDFTTVLRLTSSRCRREPRQGFPAWPPFPGVEIG